MDLGDVGDGFEFTAASIEETRSVVNAQGRLRINNT
jgi:hypothetical protein